jgi:hypothetical protein
LGRKQALLLIEGTAGSWVGQQARKNGDDPLCALEPVPPHHLLLYSSNSFGFMLGKFDVIF